MAVVQRTSPVERSLISRCNGGRAPRQQQVRRRELQCLSESNRTELAKRSQLLTREQQPNETWGALSRYSYDDRAEDNEQAAESTTFPPRYKVVLACMLAFVVCNMDKVNMSVAILPMAQEFGWSPSVAGLVQSSFFWGYMLSQIPAGYLANKFSGRWVLPGGVGVWSGFTAAVPLLTSTLPTLCVSRAAVGFGEGVAPSAVNDIVAKTIPQNERGRAISTIFGGLHIGSILGLILAPPLIKALGWPSVFYAFGALGLVWILGFEKLLSDPSKEVQDMRRSLLSGTSAAETSSNGSSASATSESADAQKLSGVPYRAFLRNGPTRALMFTHFCNNWFHYTMLAWLPTYFTQTLNLNIAEASTVSLFPSIAGVLVSSIAGQVADKLIENKVPVRKVRLLAQCTAFLVPATCLVAACSFQGTYASIICIAAALGLNSFALAGLYCTHQDMSQKFAGPLLGLTNTSGAVPGILGVAIVGLLLDLTDSWQIALFTPIIFFFLAGTAVYSMYASSEAQDYSDNTPFEFESKLLSPFNGGSQQK